jgi:hypothetical protein
MSVVLIHWRKEDLRHAIATAERWLFCGSAAHAVL